MWAEIVPIVEAGVGRTGGHDHFTRVKRSVVVDGDVSSPVEHLKQTATPTPVGGIHVIEEIVFDEESLGLAAGM